MGGGGASPYDMPDCVAVDALAPLARRVGASTVLVPPETHRSLCLPRRTLKLSRYLSHTHICYSGQSGRNSERICLGGRAMSQRRLAAHSG